MISLHDYVVHVVGEKDEYAGSDYETVGVPIFAGCQVCNASLSGYNAYPTMNGYIACEGCCEHGFDSVQQFVSWIEAEEVQCDAES